MKLTGAGVQKRLENFKAPESRFQRGVSTKYANTASGGSEGAVTT
jgi:dihydroxy-acid dehydratase